MVTRAFFILSLVLLVASAVRLDTAYAADMRTEVTVRSSKHEGFNRVVFETQDAAFLRSTVVTSLQNQIKVQFPSNVNLKSQNKLDMDTSLKDNVFTIRMNAPFKMKISQLSAPARLSIDITALTGEEGGKTSTIDSPVIIPNVRIVLDPGHGGYDLGILAVDSTREKDATLSIARIMEAALIKKNRPVYLTRKADQFLSISDRALFSNQKSADIFISIHLSPSNNFVIYTSPDETPAPDPADEAYGMMSRQRRYADKSKALAESIGKAIAEEFKKDVVFRKMELPLLNSVGAAAVMVEVPGAIASDQIVKTKVSDAFMKGVAAYAVQ